MKKYFFRAAAMRRAVSKFVVTLVVAGTAFTAHAQTSQIKQPLSAHTASVTYMGSREDMLSVAVKYDNARGNLFSVIVKDQDGYLLYQGNFSDKKFSKIFQLPKQAVSKVTFVIRNTKTKEAQSFEINARQVEEAVVKTIG